MLLSHVSVFFVERSAQCFALRVGYLIFMIGLEDFFYILIVNPFLEIGFADIFGTVLFVA